MGEEEDEEDDEEDYEDRGEGPDLDDLESRVADIENLESRVADLEAANGNHSSAGCGCGSAVYSLGATLAVVISWEANHAVLWAVLHGCLSWLYVIYVLVAQTDRVKLL